MLSVPHGYLRGRSRWWWLGLALWSRLEGCRKKRWDDELRIVSAQPDVVRWVDAQARDVFHKHWQLDARLAKFVERLQKVLFRSTVFVHYQLLVFTPEHTSYLSFFLHMQNFWRIKFILQNINLQLKSALGTQYLFYQTLLYSFWCDLKLSRVESSLTTSFFDDQ